MKKKIKKLFNPKKRYRVKLSIFDIVCLAFGRVLFWSGLFLTTMRAVGLLSNRAKELYDIIFDLFLSRPINTVIIVFCILCSIYLIGLKHEK